jgi:hypothetical protein
VAPLQNDQFVLPRWTARMPSVFSRVRVFASLISSGLFLGSGGSSDLNIQGVLQLLRDAVVTFRDVQDCARHRDPRTTRR